ncbi:MAG: nucleoid-associated protein [Chitinophagaceae bacterium]|nr:nucleoid-associated protein [Chitinophagaceae bacterium]
MKNKSDEEFITISQEAADLLAESQKRLNIPGGYLLVMDCLDEISETSIYIIIKAEPHEALRRIDGQSQISLIDKVFLSPTQKLFKIGIVYEKENPLSEQPNDRYGCFLYDDQFRLASHPAEYFYKDFLGFSVGTNRKIQSQRFFDKTERFIRENIVDIDQKVEMLRALRIEFTANQNDTVSPSQFSQTYLPAELRGQYMDEIGHELPIAIVKDTTLIKNKLNKRRIDFPNNIYIIGPAEGFDDLVHIIQADELGEIDLQDSNTTLIKIVGKPFSDE